MQKYSTANGDEIQIIAQDPDLSFSSDIDIRLSSQHNQPGEHGTIKSSSNEMLIQRLFDQDIIFDIIIKPSGSTGRKQYTGCIIKGSGWKWESTGGP